VLCIHKITHWTEMQAYGSAKNVTFVDYLEKLRCDARMGMYYGYERNRCECKEKDGVW
jgi:hypothetical protein